MDMKLHERNLIKLANRQRRVEVYSTLKTIALLMMLVLVAYVIFLGVRAIIIG